METIVEFIYSGDYTLTRNAEKRLEAFLRRDLFPNEAYYDLRVKYICGFQMRGISLVYAGEHTIGDKCYKIYKIYIG